MTKSKPFSSADVKRASFALMAEELDDDVVLLAKTMDVLTYWRDAHVQPLFQAEQLLNKFVPKIDKDAFIAKRLKRVESVKKKLNLNKNRECGPMLLTTMQDIGGIRVVLTNHKKLYDLYKVLKNEACFKQKGNILKVTNYIDEPKEFGYRGIHLIAKFPNEYNQERKIEFQLRTKLQHSWSTTLEIIDLFTGQNLKNDKGSHLWKEFFRLVSDEFCVIENSDGFVSNQLDRIVKDYSDYLMTNDLSLSNCLKIIKFINTPLPTANGKSISIEHQVKGYADSLREINDQIQEQKKKVEFILLRLNVYTKELNIEFFEKSEREQASKLYSLYEQTLSKNKNWVVAFVSTNAIGGLKEAYPNYFADSEVFWSYIKLIHLVAATVLIKKQQLMSA